MPVTFPAHQAAVIPLKMARPEWFDGTALCVGSAMPDLSYAFGSWMGRQSHTALGIVVWSIPAALVIVWVLRWRAASGIFATVPDAGPLRLRSLRVLGTRRPRWVVTLYSAAIGAASHVVIDGFTHSRRWGARWLGIDQVLGEWPLRGEYSVAAILQYVGHTAGSGAAVLLLVLVARRRLLEQWYGSDLVDAVRAVRPTTGNRVVFWGTIAAAVGSAAALAQLTGRSPLFSGLTAFVLGVVAAGSVVGTDLRRLPVDLGAADDGVGRPVDVGLGGRPARH